MPRARNTRRRIRRRHRNSIKHKQRGGQDAQVSPTQETAIKPKPLTEWFDVLKATGLLGNPSTTMSDVIRGELAIPTMKGGDGEGGDDFTLRVGPNRELMDYRVLAAHLATSPFLRSQSEFQSLFVDDENMDTLKLLQQYENDLRTAADIQPQTVTDLADKTNYPLMIWFLAANYVGNEDSIAPVLISSSALKEVSEALRSQTPSTPSETTE